MQTYNQTFLGHAGIFKDSYLFKDSISVISKKDRRGSEESN